MSYAFDWSAQAELNDIKYNSPRPCNHGAHCVYTSCCAFVHPGEEGTGRKLFPAFIRKNDDGTQVWMKAAVRLIGGASFYERRRLRLSWPDWCFRQGMPAPVRRAAASERRETLNLASSATEPAATGAAAEPAAPAAPAEPAAPTQVPGDDVRTRLYNTISMALAYGKSMMPAAGMSHPGITAAKLTGMILHSYTIEECEELIAKPEDLAEMMMKACASIIAAHAAMAVAEEQQAQLEQQAQQAQQQAQQEAI